ncbi:MAG: FecR family protein [Pseudomonas sp.]
MTPAQEEAIDWQARRSSGLCDDGDERCFQAWLGNSNENRKAWLQLQALLERSLSPLRETSPSALLDAQANPSRRAFLRGSLIVGGLALGAGTLGRPGLRSWMGADLQTRTAERAQKTLPDGSVATLEAHTRADLHFDGERRVSLHEGIILVSSQGGHIPLVLTCAQGTIHLGRGRCMLETFGDHARVWALDEAVEVVTRHHRHSVEPDNGVTFTTSGIHALHGSSRQATAWLSGSLQVQNETLGYVVQRLQAYSDGPLHISRNAAELRLSGNFNLDAPTAAIDALSDLLPIRVHRYLGWWTRIEHV